MFEAGLTYVRADFHLHTRKDKEFSFAGEDNSFVKEYVSALKNANICTILHQPMQAVNLSVDPGPGAIKPEMYSYEIEGDSHEKNPDC